MSQDSGTCGFGLGFNDLLQENDLLSFSQQYQDSDLGEVIASSWPEVITCAADTDNRLMVLVHLRGCTELYELAIGKRPLARSVLAKVGSVRDRGFVNASSFRVTVPESTTGSAR
jgi:hypothetical protein